MKEGERDEQREEVGETTSRLCAKYESMPWNKDFDLSNFITWGPLKSPELNNIWLNDT